MYWSPVPNCKHINFEDLCSSPGWISLDDINCLPFGLTKTSAVFLSSINPVISIQGVRPSENSGEFLLSTQLAINPEALFPPNLWFTRRYKVDQELSFSEPVFFGIRSWSYNYQHFLVEALPLYFLCNKMFPNIKTYLVNDDSFAVEILSRCFPDVKIVPISKEIGYKVNGVLIWASPIARNFTAIPDLLFDSLVHLRSILLKESTDMIITDNKTVLGPLFLKREIAIGNAGNSRIMLNQEDLCSAILDIKGINISFEQLTFDERVKTLASTVSRQFVTPVGANILNFIFAPLDSLIVAIKHPAFGNYWWFEQIIRRTSNGVIRWVDPSEVQDNSAFLADIDAIRNALLSSKD